VSPDTVAESSHLTFTGKNYAVALNVRSNDTIDISGKWNTGQPFYFYVTALANKKLTWGTTIRSKTGSDSVHTGTKRLYAFQYSGAVWDLTNFGYDTTATAGGSGTVTSVAISGSSGITTGGGPITTTGTLTVAGDSAGLWTLLGLGNMAHKSTPLIPTLGGTGLTSYAAGDILYASASNTLSALGIGANGTYLHSNGTTVSWVSPSTSTSSAIIDLNSPASQVIKDTVVASQPLVHVNSKPTVPQFYYVVRAADIPASTVPNSYMAVLTLGGKNRHTASAVTMNWVACRGTNPATEFAAGSSVSVPANNFWEMAAFFDSKGVAVGDTLSVKLWAGTIDTADFRYATIYFIPRLITPPNGQFYFYGQSTNSTAVPWDFTGTLFGANAGVSQVQISNQPSMFLLDSATSSAIISPIMTQTMPQLVWMIGNGTYMAFGPTSALSDIDNISSTNAVSILASLPAPNGTARRIRYIRKLTISTN
jgi:hypothetical protein